MECVQNARYHRRRAELIKQLGGKCVDCGSTENLEFDHIDPDTKLFNMGKIINGAMSRIQEEIVKCVLRCKECHDNRSATQSRSENGCGNPPGMWRCPCSLCKQEKLKRQTEYTRKWRAKNNRV